MKNKYTFGVLLLALSLMGGGIASAQEATTAAVPQSPLTEEQMAQWQKHSTPGEAHQRLNPLVGNWTYTSKMWMAADAAPTVSQGTNEAKWILGGRFLQQSIKGDFMGQPFEGISITGYDNVREEYNSVWMDNMGTGLMTTQGSFDVSKNEFSESGTFACPMTGNKEQPFRAVWRMIDNDHYVYEMYGTGMQKDGPEFKTMELSYSRA